MYHPYLRGKQFELVLLREQRDLLKRAGFVPVIEPTKLATRPLERTIRECVDDGVELVVIGNPAVGDFAGEHESLSGLLEGFRDAGPSLKVGALLTPDMEVADVVSVCERYQGFPFYLVHAGFPAASSLSKALQGVVQVEGHAFVERFCGKRYQSHFRNAPRVLLRDGFKKKSNRDYPAREFYSELHLTYEEEGVDGFGDYLIVGDDYSEAGGPAYAVAIHVTFIDPELDNEMHVFHFVSDRNESPTDPAGKFGEAVGKLVAEVRRQDSPVYRTSAIQEFINLHAEGHYPGLGFVKKLSMQHHLETLARFADTGG